MANSKNPDDVDWDDAARMELEPDAVHEGEGGYYFDCPECGSPATIDNIIEEGRCNGYLNEQVEGVDVDMATVSCSARLQLELAYTADPQSET
ncbi:hypothetical protein [Halorussus pelagicus]|uniref:hypothetical protein n=1 Tax=Halorussus pelagicus TaxID=2505977 RepID=UPI001AA0862E|nr:hypothetical protein [Halorussus pelagicus]